MDTQESPLLTKMYKKKNVENNTYMMKKVLFSIFLIVSLFVFINSYKAKIDKCLLYKTYNNISTTNLLKIKSNSYLKNIKKVCTKNICTYNLDNDFNYLIKSHISNVLETIKNDDTKIDLNLKGIKIDTIYFKDCI